MRVESVAVTSESLSNGSKGKPFNLPSLEQISADLSNRDASIVLKMSHLFALREWGGDKATELLIQALRDRIVVDSVLFRHEAAYVLGQLGSKAAVSFLEEVLADHLEDEMVRHEAAEALAAIGSKQSLTTLSAYLEDASIPVKETCELAVYSLKHKSSQEAAEGQNDPKSCFNTVDPSNAFEGCTAADVPRLFNLLKSPEEPLWKRYRALFTLRDLRVPAATAAVARTLRHDGSSALLRHELAFVLGQIQFPAENTESATPFPEVSRESDAVKLVDAPPMNTSADAAALEAAEALIHCLKNPREHSMARHEAALALGSLGADARAKVCYCKGESLRDAAVSALQAHRTCSDKVVAESCLVALSNMQDELNMSFGV